MKEIIQFEGHELEIQRRARQRTLVLAQRRDGGLRMTCARGVPKKDILRFLEQSRDFIAKTVLRTEALRRQFPLKQMISGEEFLFLGRKLPLDVVWGWQKRIQVEAREDALEMRAPVASTQEERAKALRMFFRKQAELHLPEEVAACARRMQLFPKNLSVRGQVSRWGSCSSRGMISLNWKLMATPVEVIRYVVVHELAHLEQPNHSSKFWALVERHDPGCKEHRQWLKDHEFPVFQQFK